MAAPATCFGSRPWRCLGPPEEVLGQQRDVVAPLAQGRHAEGDDVEAVVQVLAHLAAGDQPVDVPVGGDHEPDVEGDHDPAAQPADLPRFEDAEQVDLGLGHHLADLVEQAACRPGPSRTSPASAAARR